MTQQALRSCRTVLLCILLSPASWTPRGFDAAISEYQGLLAKDPGSLIVANNLASLLADHRTDKASLDQAEHWRQACKARRYRNSRIPGLGELS